MPNMNDFDWWHDFCLLGSRVGLIIWKMCAFPPSSWIWLNCARNNQVCRSCWALSTTRMCQTTWLCTCDSLLRATCSENTPSFSISSKEDALSRSSVSRWVAFEKWTCGEKRFLWAIFPEGKVFMGKCILKGCRCGLNYYYYNYYFW